MEQYDTIFLGYPIWWDTFPMPVFTFLESYNFAGKTILPFCTHEGSGKGTSIQDIKRLCPEANVLPCLVIRGGSVEKSDSLIHAWLEKIKPLL
jgi:flavodoxin